MTHAQDKTLRLRGEQAASDFHVDPNGDQPNRGPGQEIGPQQVGVVRANPPSTRSGLVRARRDTVAGGILRGLIASAKQQRDLLDAQIENLEGLLATLEERISENPGD